MCVQIHTHYLSEVLAQTFFFISHNKSVYFSIKQFKHNNDFLYYAKYKSSWDTLSTHSKKKKKNLNFWLIKMTPLDFTDSRHTVHQRLELSWRYYCPAFQLPESWLWVDQLWHFVQVHPPQVQWQLSLLTEPAMTAVEERGVPRCFECISGIFIKTFCVNILHKYKSLTQKPRSRWDRVMVQYSVMAVWFNLHFTWCKSPICP